MRTIFLLEFFFFFLSSLKINENPWTWAGIHVSELVDDVDSKFLYA